MNANRVGWVVPKEDSATPSSSEIRYFLGQLATYYVTANTVILDEAKIKELGVIVEVLW